MRQTILLIIMEAILERSLASFGFAQAIVMMKPSMMGAKEAPAKVVQNFMSKIPFAASTVAAHKKEAPPFRYFPLLGVCVGYVDNQGAAQIEAQKDDVEAVFHGDPLSLIRPVRVGLARLRETLTWGLRILRLERIWDQGITGKGVRVGHLDTGVDAKHKALRGKIKGFMEFDMSGERLPRTRPYDSGEHGTHTAGTICGGKIGGEQIGVAPEADLYSGLVIERGEVLYRVLNGMEWCLENKVRVLSMSLGLRGYTPFFVGIMRRLRTQGVLPVMAIGNEGPRTSRSPGNYPEALSVGAVDARRRIASFSSSIVFSRSDDPKQPNVVAPGVDIVSAKPGGGAQSMDGTSMATPHVAGLAALLFQIKPEAVVDEVENAIQLTCDPLKYDSPERYGFGVINPIRAVENFAGSR